MGSLVFLILMSFYFPADAAMYKSYVFDAWGRAVPTPEPYEPVRIIYGSDIGVGELIGPEDLFVAPDNTLYIVDTRNNRIVRTTSNFELLEVYAEFERADGTKDRFNNPLGVFVTDEGHMFVADTNNGRIVRFDENGRFMMTIEAPEKTYPEAFPAYFQFRPTKIAIDQVGRLYVTSAGLYEGLIELDLNGNFRTFMGAPPVYVGIWDYFWGRIATDEQRQRRQLNLPTEYSSMDLDARGFIYTTVSGGDIDVTEVVRQLSPAGKDILKRDGFWPPMGDINVFDEMLLSEVTGYSLLVDIICRENGIYSVLDQRRGRIFTYDNHGNLLYVFGGLGQGTGLFVRAVAIEQLGDQLLVLDSRNNSITVFKPTKYAQLIHQAIDEYEQGRYEDSAALWFEVMKYNANYELAYSGVGDAYLRQGDYEQAMLYYRLGNDRPGYSDAFYRYRRELMNEYFGTFMNWVLVIAAVIFAAAKRQWIPRAKAKYRTSQLAAALASERVQQNRVYAAVKGTLSKMRYALHVIFHPFDGFWDLKYDNRGSFAAATVILLMAALSFVFMRQYTGFVLNYNRIEDLNIFVEAVSIIIPFLLWCVVNWGLTTLMDGKGRMIDIYIAGAYALTPMVLIFIPATIFSNYITVDEGTFYYLLVTIGTVWSLSLLFLGAGVIHEYGFGKTIFTTAATIVGIGIVLFVGLLFFDVIDRMSLFIQDLYTEIALRL